MQVRKLAILMLKHGMVRMRHYIGTPLEFLSPLIFILILFLLRNSIRPVPPAGLQDASAVRYTDELSFDELWTPSLVLYTPDNNMTSSLMHVVGQRLKIKPLTKSDSENSKKGYYGIKNFPEISGWLEKLRSNDAIVLFHNLEGAVWPNHLSYTIRMRGAYFTNEIKARDGTAKPHREFGRIYHQFMGLQWALDSSFIEVMSGKNITLPLSVQEFASIGLAVKDEGAVMMCELLTVVCGFLSLAIVFVIAMAAMVVERASGIQELVKMVGVSSNLFGFAQFLNVLPSGLVYCIGGTCLLKCFSNPIIIHTNGFIIFTMLALHYLSVIGLAFACSYISDSTQYATSIAVAVYIALWMPARFTSVITNMKGIKLLTGMGPHTPIVWLWIEIGAKEAHGAGIKFPDIFKSHSSRSGSIALGAFYLVLQILIGFGLAWYLARVRPGKYGQALPWNFLFQKQYWTKNEVKPESDVDEEAPIVREAKYFEEPPQNVEVGIKIENVSKVYPKHTAVNNVSFNVYKGEITVLLGHNGAGKTTLMSVITGMTSATQGRVLVHGLDVAKSSEQIRQHLGLCPQYNLFFPDLLVQEHILFFTMLKGVPYYEAREQSEELLSRLGLLDKASVPPSALSGGMKRRLQLACALAGGADVLVLDEPTSGLDVETRRALWDLLLSLRGDRTVLLTTHFMEEADALGDRIAALHEGRLRCHATPMHLKKAIGTGYRLTFTTNGPPREDAITRAVTSYVPDATLKEKTINSLSYNLPATASGSFPNLFTNLEEKRSDLGIESIGVGISTLEEVFLQLCSDTNTMISESEMGQARAGTKLGCHEKEEQPTFNKVTGFALWARQTKVLLRRQLKYAWNRKIAFFVLELILPIVFICLFTYLSNKAAMEDSDEKASLDMNMYSRLGEPRVLLDVPPDVNLRALRDAFPKSNFIKAPNVTAAVLRATEDDPTEYEKFITGIEIDDKHVKALYTTTLRHAAPVSVNLLSNALATRYMSGGDGRTFRASFEPLAPLGPVRVQLDTALVLPKDTDSTVTYAVFIMFIILSTATSLVSLSCKERASGTRHIHTMCGCPSVLHWAVTCLFHLLCCALVLSIAVVFAALALDKDSTFKKPYTLMSFVLVILVACLAFYAFMYTLSFFFKETYITTLLVLIIIIFGVVIPIMDSGSKLFGVNQETSIWSILWAIVITLSSYLMPPYSATFAFVKVAGIARLNALCDLNKNKCPNLLVAEDGFDIKKCCAGENPRRFMYIDKYAPGKELLILTGQFIVYMTLVVLLQRGLLNCLHDYIFNICYRNSRGKTHRDEDNFVRAEALYVKKQIGLPRKDIKESGQAMLVSDLHKNYFRICGRSCNAVRGISLSVKKGECFGLLGVNGAGKSTTFKMLTGEECPTLGEIYANGYFKKERVPYLQSLGYCPQFFGLDEFQTGRENLELVLTLRGLDKEDVSREVKSWIEVVGLQKYINQKVSGYSGGCMRRLAAAAALCSGSPLTLLDEPTAGVDVSARRRVWRALQRGLLHGRAVIITSHSMDEMEALCSRIAIMSGGVVRALGTPSELRARYAAGHAVLIKMTHAPSDQVDGAKSDLERFKTALQSKFNCTLKDEHMTMLHYHINETMRYSNLFSELEALKASYPSLVEDYSVTETTLEEVFLSFAKDADGTDRRRNHVV